MTTFPKMADLIAPAVIGEASVHHHEITPLQASIASIRRLPTRAGVVAVLKVGGVVMMSDSLNEQLTNYEVVHDARGDMLIAGLGIGMILHPILAKSDVRSVTVLEKSADVISLIRPTLPKDDRLTIVHADVFTWKPAPHQKFDGIYFDIWPDISADNYAETKTLHRRARYWKKPGGWVDSWCRETFREMAR